MMLTLSEWFYEGILMDGGLLSINPVYFSITGGRERWLYRVARKHAGGAGAEGFAIALSTLFKKSGAEGTYRRFKFEMLAIVQENNLPQFTLSLDYGKGEPLLRMTRRQPQPAMPLQTSVPSKRQAASNSQSRPSLPLLQPQRALSSETLDRLRRECPGLDLYELQSEFDAWIADKPAHMPAYYEKAFAGFVRHRYAKQA
jgi:hypothetical protein